MRRDDASAHPRQIAAGLIVIVVVGRLCLDATHGVVTLAAGTMLVLTTGLVIGAVAEQRSRRPSRIRRVVKTIRRAVHDARRISLN